MFGRVAAGLVHDLSHPIQNIGNSTRLLLRDDLDAGIARACSAAPSSASSQTLKRFMDDLRNVVKPKPIERFAMDVNASVAEIVESMRAEGERNGVTVEAQLRAGPLVIDGDRFALGRVYRNLITNAIQATAAGRPRHDRDRRAPATTSRSASPTPARAFPPIGCRRSSTTSSRPSAAASASAWRSPSASSSSSTARSPSRAKSDAARRSRCGFRRATIDRRKRPQAELQPVRRRGGWTCFGHS